MKKILCIMLFAILLAVTASAFDTYSTANYSTSDGDAWVVGGGGNTGTLTIDPDGSFIFEGATADAYETSIAVTDPTADRTATFPDATGTVLLSTSAVRTSQQYVQSIAYAKVGAGAGWTIGAADNVSLATMPASQTSGTMVIPITIPLKVGWTITAFSINGQLDSAGNTATLDADLRKHTEATAGYADASVGAITQISKTADYKIVDSKTGLAEVVAADESYYLLLTGTTAATTDIEIASVTVTVSEL